MNNADYGVTTSTVREEGVCVAPERETIFTIAIEMQRNAEELERTIEQIRSVLYGESSPNKNGSDVENRSPNIEEILKDTNNLLHASRKALEYIKEGLV